MHPMTRQTPTEAFAALAQQFPTDLRSARLATGAGRHASRPRFSELALWLALAVALGVACFFYVHGNKAASAQRETDHRIALLDREISDRLYHWLALSEAEDAGTGMLLDYVQLLRKPAREAGAMAALTGNADFADRGLLSLVLELQSYMDEPTAGGLDRVIALIISPEPLLSDCGTQRECAYSLAFNLMLDRWRQ